MAQPVEPGNHLPQCRQEHLPILVVLKNILASIPTRGDVVKGMGEFYSDGARHSGEIYPELGFISRPDPDLC